MNRFLLAIGVAVAFSGCSRTSYPTDPYPPTDPRYPNPGETRYPNPFPSEDNSTTYPREGQKDGVVTIIKTSNNNYEYLPPGRAKKKYGSQSAKVYAPGQRKKNGGYNRMATVISVPDIYASRATSGQLYYNYRGNVYWKQNDGYYHLSGNGQFVPQSQVEHFQVRHAEIRNIHHQYSQQGDPSNGIDDLYSFCLLKWCSSGKRIMAVKKPGECSHVQSV